MPLANTFQIFSLLSQFPWITLPELLFLFPYTVICFITFFKYLIFHYFRKNCKHLRGHDRRTQLLPRPHQRHYRKAYEVLREACFITRNGSQMIYWMALWSYEHTWFLAFWPSKEVASWEMIDRRHRTVLCLMMGSIWPYVKEKAATSGEKEFSFTTIMHQFTRVRSQTQNW